MEYFSYTILHGFCLHSTLKEACQRLNAVMELEREESGATGDWLPSICINCCGKLTHRITQVLDGQSDFAALFDTAEDYQVKEVDSDE